MKRVAVFGSTGSIGLSTLAVLRENPSLFDVTVLTGWENQHELGLQIKEFSPQLAVLASKPSPELELLAQHAGTKLEWGRDALVAATQGPYDVAMLALVGAAGLELALEIAQKPVRLCLANKESIVCGGALLAQYAQQSGCVIMPVDSEHNALFQLLEGHRLEDVRKLWITASGGPFRERPLDSFSSITPQEAVAHPNWSMGAKISVDSATMMNKGLELIEAGFFFPLPDERLGAVIHPQSLVHGLVQFHDGSCLAHMSETDMQVPIRRSLIDEQRLFGGEDILPLLLGKSLEFDTISEDRYPCFYLARQAMKEGTIATNILNAANEVAVAAFLECRIPFTAISEIVEEVLNLGNFASELGREPSCLEQLHVMDDLARKEADLIMKKRY